MRISIIGSGCLGRATGIGFQMHGNDVIFHDIDKEKLVTLREEGYRVNEDIFETVSSSTVSFVCVQTPTTNGQMDFSYVEKAIKDISAALAEKEEYHLLVVRSTVLPSTTRTRVIPLLDRYSRKRLGKDYGVCVNPGFLKHTEALNDFSNPSRILIGQFDQRSGDTLEKLYSQFSAPIIRTDLDTAEMIKYVANTFLATKISFFNEMFMICKSLHLDPHLISEAVALDPRIGNYGIHGGRPFGGACLPKDLEAFIHFAKTKAHNPKLLEAVIEINKQIIESGTPTGKEFAVDSPSKKVVYPKISKCS